MIEVPSELTRYVHGAPGAVAAALCCFYCVCSLFCHVDIVCGFTTEHLDPIDYTR